MKKHYLLVLLVLSSYCWSQNKKKTEVNNDEMMAAVNMISQNLQSNPDNPLQIDKAFLSQFSNQIEPGQLKDLLESYANNLGTDTNLSFRQVYWDIMKGFEQQPQLGSMAAFSNTNNGLNLMFNNTQFLVSKLQKTGGNYQLGEFLNDPAIMNSLANITGSYESAQALGLGIQAIADISTIIAENNQIREDYKKMAKAGMEGIYIENDINLNKCLIDANLGFDGNNQITTLYRYDFDSGATIRVENGILKYINTKKGMVKDLMVVESRHDGEFFRADRTQDSYGGIIIAPDEKYFYVKPQYNSYAKVKCANCIENAVIINAETGEETKFFVASSYFLGNSNFTSNGKWDTHHMNFMKKNDLKMTKVSFDIATKEAKTVDAPLQLGTPFSLNGESKPFNHTKDGPGYLFYQKGYYVFDTEQASCGLIWVHTKTDYINDVDRLYSSSMFQVFGGNSSASQKVLVNELTGLAMGKDKTLFFINKDGAIGKLSGGGYDITDPHLSDQIMKALKKTGIAGYDFVANRTYASDLGRRGSFGFRILPSLQLSPDEKCLVYIIKNNLYVINPNDLNDVRHFTMTIESYNSFFTKENGDWVINVQALNDFKFPVTKKYSLGRLSTIKIEKPKAAAVSEKQTKNDNNASAPASSLADELKKLKELYDSGALTEEEFTAAKSKLLGNTNNTSPVKKNAAKPISKTSNAVMSFQWNDNAYFAIKAPNDLFNGLYKYTGKEPRFFEYTEGEPIVLLEKNQQGRYQRHGTPSVPVTWWLESDATGNLEIINGELADRYFLVVRFEEGNQYDAEGTFNRMSLDVYKDGSKIVILGERIRELK